MIHAVDITGCPFDQRIDTMLATAHHRLITHQVDENDFDTPRQGRRASDLYAELLATRPTDTAPVFVHGDYCLPNILIDPDRMTLMGFIDWGSAGISDPLFGSRPGGAQHHLQSRRGMGRSRFSTAYGLHRD